MGGQVNDQAQPQGMDPEMIKRMLLQQAMQRQAAQRPPPRALGYSEGEAFGPRQPLTGQTQLGGPSWAGQQKDPAGALLKGGAAFKPGAVDKFPSSSNIEDRRNNAALAKDQKAFGQQGDPNAQYSKNYQPRPVTPGEPRLDADAQHPPLPAHMPPPMEHRGVSDPRIESAPGVAREGIYSQAAHRLLQIKPNISGAEFLKTMQTMMPFLNLDEKSMAQSHKMEMDELKEKHKEELDAEKTRQADERADETKQHHVAEEQRKLAEEQRKGFEAITKRQTEERKQLELKHKQEREPIEDERKKALQEFKERVEAGREKDRELRTQKQIQEAQRMGQAQRRLETAESREKRLGGKQPKPEKGEAPQQEYGGTEGQPKKDNTYRGAAERMRKMKAPDTAGAPDTSTWETRTFQGKTYRLKPNTDRTKQENWIADE